MAPLTSSSWSCPGGVSVRSATHAGESAVVEESWASASSLVAHRGPTKGHREHDAEADGRQGADDDPQRADMLERSAVPQREADPESQDDVPDEKHMNESHGVLWAIVRAPAT